MTADSSKRRWLLGAGCAAVVGAGALAYALLSPSTGKGADGAALLSVSLPDLDGHAQALDQWRGKVLVVNFWATWCAPCQQEMPQLNRLYQKYRSSGFVLLGVNVDDDPSKAAEVVTKLGVTFPVLLDADKRVSKLYDLNTMPSTVIIDRDGKVRYVHRGYLAGYEDNYEKQIRELLK